MKSILKLLLCLMLILPLSAAAQDVTTQSVDLGDGYTITVPANWEVTTEDDGAFTLSDEAITVSVITPTRLNDLDTNFPADSNVVDVLVDLAFLFEGVDLEPASVQKTRYDARPAAIYINSDDESVDHLYAAVTLSDGAFGYLSFSGAKDDFAAFSAQIDDIIATFDSDTVVNPDTPVAGVECTVSTETANSAQLRVGPGTNRGAISFLPTGADVTVTGRIELDDGSIWYQLDKSEAAPNGTAAAELWVNADEVDASGDCEHVGESAAPPVIPIAVAPPPANTAQPGASPVQQTGPGTLPAAGGWIITLNPTTNASCLGGDNFPVASSQVFDPTSYGVTVLIVNDSSFTFGGDPFTRIPGTNNFIGSFTYEDGSNEQAYFYLTSPTTMNGQIVFNATFEGTACSATVLFTAYHG